MISLDHSHLPLAPFLALPALVNCQSGSWRNLFPTKKTDYRADCDGCGTKTIDLGVHNICTLNVVMNARGANSGCFLQRLGTWSLSSIDPAPPDSETQTCYATCLNF